MSASSVKSKSPITNGEAIQMNTMVNGVSSKIHGDADSMKDIKNSLTPPALQAMPVSLRENVVVSEAINNLTSCIIAILYFWAVVYVNTCLVTGSF